MTFASARSMATRSAARARVVTSSSAAGRVDIPTRTASSWSRQTTGAAVSDSATRPSASGIAADPSCTGRFCVSTVATVDAAGVFGQARLDVLYAAYVEG